MTRDALCGVTAEGPLVTKLTSGCCPRAGGLGRGQGSSDAVGAPCALCGSAQLAQLQGRYGDPFLTPSLGQHFSGPALWDTTMSALKRGCAHRKNRLGNAALFQVLSLLMAFAARERPINLYAITATSFWYHDTQALRHRPVTGFRWVVEAYFTSRVQLRLWIFLSIKIFHELFLNSLGWKGPLVIPDPTLAHTGPAQSKLLEAVFCQVPCVSKDGEPPSFWVTGRVK